MNRRLTKAINLPYRYMNVLGCGIPLIENKNEIQMFELIQLTITNVPFHVFSKRLIPYSRCSRTYGTDIQDVSARVFPGDVRICRFPYFATFQKYSFPENIIVFLESIRIILWVQGHIELVVGPRSCPPGQEIMKMKTF